MLSFEKLKKLWIEFGDISINENDEIEQDFYIDKNLMFPSGTNRFEIWHWFDNLCPNSLHDDLMFPKENKL